MLVEQRASGGERDTERGVLRLVPAHGGLDHEAPLGEQIERREVLREQERMPQRRDDRRRGEPEPRRGGGDRREEDERAGPRHRRVLVSGKRVVARVRHQPAGAGARAEYDVLAHHDRVEAGVLRLLRHPHQGAEVRGGVSVQFSERTCTSRMGSSAAARAGEGQRDQWRNALSTWARMSASASAAVAAPRPPRAAPRARRRRRPASRLRAAAREQALRPTSAIQSASKMPHQGLVPRRGGERRVKGAARVVGGGRRRADRSATTHRRRSCRSASSRRSAASRATPGSSSRRASSRSRIAEPDVGDEEAAG